LKVREVKRKKKKKKKKRFQAMPLQYGHNGDHKVRK